MPWVIAIMLFLTVLAAALRARRLRGAARALDRQLAGRLTVQIVEADAAASATRAGARDASRRCARLPGVAARDAGRPRASSTRLLEPVAGRARADPELPVPALIDVDLRGRAPMRAAARRARVRARRARRRGSIAHARWLAPVGELHARR